MDGFARQAAALEADQVEAGELGMIAERHAVGNDVGVDAGDAADHRALADAAELLNGGEAAENHALADMDMSGERGIVGECDVVFDEAVVADMAAGHEVAVVADGGDAAAAAAAAVHGHAFADDAVAADDETGFGEIVLADLAFAAEHGLRMDDSAGADLGMARTTTWETRRTPSPSTAWRPTRQNGPISTPAPSCAPSSTIADG